MAKGILSLFSMCVGKSGDEKSKKKDKKKQPERKEKQPEGKENQEKGIKPVDFEAKKSVKSRSTHPLNLVIYQADQKSPDKSIIRPYIPDDNVKWSVSWPEYSPEFYTSPKIVADPPPDWADPKNVKEIVNWNAVDGKIDRRSHHGEYKFSDDGYPLNPFGRTGIKGRGHLGKWGPNHAADPIVTRWKRTAKNEIVKDAETGRPILQFVAIQRKDTKEWAIPGGMCDPGEKVSVTLKREFMEEATNSLGQSEETKKKISERLDQIFSKGKEIYRGHVDDPRNTDNSWMETIAYNFHDEDNTTFVDFQLSAGDDAGNVKWMDIDSDLKLYASHKEFIQKTVDLHKAHW